MDCAQAHAAWFARLGEGAPRIETERFILRMWQVGDFERFHPDAQGQGYATEACSAAIDWAFGALGWSEVIHSIGIDNRASQRVAEKLGSTIQRRIDNEAPFEGYVVDVWGQRREHWLARKPLS